MYNYLKLSGANKHKKNCASHHKYRPQNTRTSPPPPPHTHTLQHRATIKLITDLLLTKSKRHIDTEP